MHSHTFQYLMPTHDQHAAMTEMRHAFTALGAEIERLVPPGPDRDLTFSRLREAAMWCNIAITRMPDGSPRPEVI